MAMILISKKNNFFHNRFLYIYISYPQAHYFLYRLNHGVKEEEKNSFVASTTIATMNDDDDDGIHIISLPSCRDAIIIDARPTEDEQETVGLKLLDQEWEETLY